MNDLRIVIDESPTTTATATARRLIHSTLLPAWLTAFIVNIALLLVLAIWIFPVTINDQLIVMEAAVPQLEEFEPLEFKLESEPPPLPDTLQFETDQLAMDLELPDLPSEDLADDLFSVADPLAAPLDDSGMPVNTILVNDVELTKEGKKIAAIQERVSGAGGRTGDVQFSLAWNTHTDLDLHVVTPQGVRIHYRDRKSPCNGKLDVDQNAKSDKLTETPVENVRWIKHSPAGRFTVWVHLFQRRSNQRRANFEIMGKTGAKIDLQSDFVTNSKRVAVFRYIRHSANASPELIKRQKDAVKSLQEREEATATRLLNNVVTSKPNWKQELWTIIREFPHTDAAVQAWLRLPGDARK